MPRKIFFATFYVIGQLQLGGIQYKWWYTLFNFLKGGVTSHCITYYGSLAAASVEYIRWVWGYAKFVYSVLSALNKFSRLKTSEWEPLICVNKTSLYVSSETSAYSPIIYLMFFSWSYRLLTFKLLPTYCYNFHHYANRQWRYFQPWNVVIVQSMSSFMVWNYDSTLGWLMYCIPIKMIMIV